MNDELVELSRDREKMPEFVKVEFPQYCLNNDCGGSLVAKHIIMSGYPYIHADVRLECELCDVSLLYGVPLDRLAGLTFQFFDSKPLLRDLTEIQNIPFPTCPIHNKKMRLTKVFGDLASPEGYYRIQYKCPICFLTRHTDGKWKNGKIISMEVKS